ncbi:MAG TPA: response regulator, partial [Fibrobacteria bacterium]|nr:response regulator [Fibrobacteria bacterium]
MDMKLLLIDDEKSILESLTRALQGQDLDILASNDPERALEMVKEKDPHVVISDLKMPKMDGLELLGRIKA